MTYYKRKTKQHDETVETEKIQAAATIKAARITSRRAIIAALIGAFALILNQHPVQPIPTQPTVIEQVQVIQQFNYYEAPNSEEQLLDLKIPPTSKYDRSDSHRPRWRNRIRR